MLSTNKVDPPLHTCDKKVDPTIVGSRTQRESRSFAYQHTWQIVGEEVTPTRLWVTRGKYSSPPSPHPHVIHSPHVISHTRTHTLFFEKHTNTLYISTTAKTAKPQNLDTLPIHYYSLFQ